MLTLHHRPFRQTLEKIHKWDRKRENHSAKAINKRDYFYMFAEVLARVFLLEF